MFFVKIYFNNLNLIFFLRINEDEEEPEEPILENGIDNPGLLNDTNDIPRTTESDVNMSEEDYDDDTYGLWIGSKNTDLVRGSALLLQQFSALIVKRITNSLRNRGLVVTQIIVPIAILLVNLFYVKYGPIKAEDSPALTMNLSSYSPNNIPYFLSSENQSSFAHSAMKAYGAQFKSMPNTLAYDLSDNVTNANCLKQRSGIDEYISCIGRDNLYAYINNYIVGTEFKQVDSAKMAVVGYFNNQPYHTPATALNLITNGLLKYLTNKPEASITVINHPLPRNIIDQANDITTKGQEGQLIIDIL